MWLVEAPTRARGESAVVAAEPDTPSRMKQGAGLFDGGGGCQSWAHGPRPDPAPQAGGVGSRRRHRRHEPAELAATRLAQLGQLADLRAAGALTDAEFEQRKALILDS